MSGDGDEMVTVGEVLHDGVVVPLPEPKHQHMTAEKAREMAFTKAEREKEKRAERQLQRQKRAKAVLGDAVDEAQAAVLNKSLDRKTVEELADMQVTRMLKVVLLGGEAFLPTSPKEAMELATAASQIATREAQRRKLASIGDPTENETDALSIQRAMRTIRTAARNAGKAAGD